MIAGSWPEALPPEPSADELAALEVEFDEPAGEVVDLFPRSMPADATPPMLAAALELARQGFPVLPLHTPVNGACDCRRRPCNFIGKHPRTMHGLTEATTDEARIRRWWGMWAEANVGLVIPPGFVALDFDVEEASAVLDGRPLPPTATSRTGRGWHFLYRTDRPIAPKVGILPHLDLRGPGSYIVAPPSRHVSGATYTWIAGLDEIAEAPSWVAELAQDRGITITGGGAPPIAEVILDGQRNATLARVAGTMRRRGLSVAAITAALLEENAARCRPPLPDAEVRAIAASVGRYPPEAEKRSREGDVPSARTNAEAPAALPFRPARAVLTLAEILAAEIPTPPSRVAGLLPGEGFGILAGPRKHGKTLTELQLGLCVAGGIPFLGRAVAQTPVLIIEEEGAALAMQSRLRGQAEALGVPADAPLHIAHRQRFRVDHPGDVAEIDKLMESTGAGLVIIGPLAQVAAIDENSNSTDGMGPIVRTMTDLAARHGALVKLVHHLRKPVGAAQAPKSVDEFFYRVRGADALVAGVDVALGLWREPEATEGTLYVLERDGVNLRIPLLFDARSLTFSVNPEPDDPMALDVARFLEVLGSHPGRWYTRMELEGATGWGRTKVTSVGMYAFGEGGAQQRTGSRNAREWRVDEPFMGGAE